MKNSIKTFTVAALAVVLFFTSQNTIAQKEKAQKKTGGDEETTPKKYPSLLWEITGNGLTKPSYLFGTMHISNKMVFNLGDSFYNAVENVDVVALEQDPELWQEEFSKNDFYNNYNEPFYGYLKNKYNVPNDRLTISTFSTDDYETEIKSGLSQEARMVNMMLYRSNPGMEDFEEETYLDMYIYRMGKKLNKHVTGLENFKESDKLVKEAYIALYKDRSKKNVNYGNGYEDRKIMEDAYRKGDLDVMDSLHTENVISEAFEEKFLYKRNEIQANSIDTVLKHHPSIFAGVGAAHLPGKRGVIEMLRAKGYKLRPVTMNGRDSDEKDRLEKIRVPMQFSKQYTHDSLISIDIPGKKFYKYPNYGNLDMVQLADMSNGSYYMLTRIHTNALILGHSQETVLKKIDSLLYENIPGKILVKKQIYKNGFSGYDITSRTRKGDVQRYNVYVLPDEILILKVSGIGEYVKDGNEADNFFSSVKFADKLSEENPAVYEQPYGGFKVSFPAQPQFIAQEDNDYARSEWLAKDKNGNVFFIYKATINQFEYVEEDTFELRLMEESFTDSKIFKKKEPGTLAQWNKYPVLNALYTHNDGSAIKLRYLIQGINYYIIGSKYKADATPADNFISSFQVTPANYGEVKEFKDTVLGFTVKSPLFYKEEKKDDDFSLTDLYDAIRNQSDDNDVESYMDMFQHFSAKTIGNDTTGEHILFISFKMPSYTYIKDSIDLYKSKMFREINIDSDFIVKSKKTYTTASKWNCGDYVFTDTGSSRLFTMKSVYRGDRYFIMAAMSDSITGAGYFVKNFLESFTPADTFPAFSPFEKKSGLLFTNYFGKDSSARKKAIAAISPAMFDSSDLPQVKKAISNLSWSDKKYLLLKKKWIDVIGNFHDTASVDYLAGLYSNVKDTSDLQNTILDALLDMKTAYSFSRFKDLIVSEPPALTSSSGDDYYGRYNVQSVISQVLDNDDESSARKYYGDKWYPLYDTLQLAAQIIPGMLDLITMDDYKDDIIELLAAAVDSGYIKADEYRQYFNKFLLEAKQLVKKRAASEEKRKINKLNNKQDSDTDDEEIEESYDYDYSSGYRNSDSHTSFYNYTVLLLPFAEQSQEVTAFTNKVLQLQNKDLKLEIALLMLHKNKPVADSILNQFAKDDNYRTQLYSGLEEINMTDKFPAAYKNQASMAKAMLAGMTNNYNKPDTIVYLDKIQVNNNRNQGWAYFYKYKRTKDDNNWFVAMSGLQPADTLKLNAESVFGKNGFTGYTNETYSASAAKTKFQQLIKEWLYANRKSSESFYEKDDEGDYDYSSDVIKSRRYE